MQATMQRAEETARYARCVEISKRIYWDIERDVFRGRTLDFTQKFLPDGLSLVDRMDLSTAAERRLMSQIQGRTYANVFGLVERFIVAKVLELSREHSLGDQTALEALVRFGDEELKHQALFRRLEQMMAEGMPAGYTFMPDPDAVARAVLGRQTWAVLAFTCHIELFTQHHYLQSMQRDPELSELWKDVFLFHWKEESQHAVLDELEWAREDRRLAPEAREQAVTDFIELVAAFDGLLQTQAAADVDYFVRVCGRPLTGEAVARLRSGVLAAYRWQYIVSGVREARFHEVLAGLITDPQGARIGAALAPLM